MRATRDGTKAAIAATAIVGTVLGVVVAAKSAHGKKKSTLLEIVTPLLTAAQLATVSEVDGNPNALETTDATTFDIITANLSAVGQSVSYTGTAPYVPPTVIWNVYVVTADATGELIWSDSAIAGSASDAALAEFAASYSTTLYTLTVTQASGTASGP